MTRANLLTLSRAGSAALLAGTAAAPQVGRRIAWWALIWGGPSDWLDGPLARRGGATALGALLDIEADSWLTLWAAMAAWRTGALPVFTVLPPLLRYVIPGFRARGKRARPVDRPWQRIAAGLQMTALTCSLGPARRIRPLGRIIAPIGDPPAGGYGFDHQTLAQEPELRPTAMGRPRISYRLSLTSAFAGSDSK